MYLKAIVNVFPFKNISNERWHLVIEKQVPLFMYFQTAKISLFNEEKSASHSIYLHHFPLRVRPSIRYNYHRMLLIAMLLQTLDCVSKMVDLGRKNHPPFHRPNPSLCCAVLPVLFCV